MIGNAAARREAFADRALQMFLSQPRESVSVEAVAEALLLTKWQGYKIFRNTDQMFRAAAAKIAGRVEAEILKPVPSPASVREAIRVHAEHLAVVFGSELYLQFIYLVIRDACAHPCLTAHYEKKVVQNAKRELAAAIRGAGEKFGAVVQLRDGAAEVFLNKLQATVALPRVLPNFRHGSDTHLAALIACIEKEVMEATFVLGWHGRRALEL